MTNNNINKQQYDFLDILRILSMFYVVFLHCSADPLRGDMCLNVW